MNELITRGCAAVVESVNGRLTCTETSKVLRKLPEVPVIVTTPKPTAVVDVVPSVNVREPLPPATGATASTVMPPVAVAASWTSPVNPASGATVTGRLALPPKNNGSG